MFISTTAKHGLKDFCALPAEALRGEGVWRKVKPAALKIWAYLWYRSAWPEDKNPGKPATAKLLGMTYNAFKANFDSLVALDLVVEHDEGLEIVVPGRQLREKEDRKIAIQEKTNKGQEEIKTERPAIRRIDVAAVPDVAPREKPAAPVKVAASSAPIAPGLASELAIAWNNSNRGHLRTNVDAYGFQELTIGYLRKVSSEIDIPVEEIVRVVVKDAQPSGEYRSWAKEGSTPSYVFNERNRSQIVSSFREELRMRSIEKEHKANRELITFVESSIEKIGDYADTFTMECIVKGEQCGGALAAFKRLAERIGESRTLALKENMYSILEKVSEAVIASDTYNKFLANKEKKVLVNKTQRDAETGKVVYVKTEEIVSTKADYFPILNTHNKAMYAEENFLNNLLNAYEFYSINLGRTMALEEE